MTCTPRNLGSKRTLKACAPCNRSTTHQPCTAANQRTGDEASSGAKALRYLDTEIVLELRIYRALETTLNGLSESSAGPIFGWRQYALTESGLKRHRNEIFKAFRDTAKRGSDTASERTGERSDLAGLGATCGQLPILDIAPDLPGASFYALLIVRGLAANQICSTLNGQWRRAWQTPRRGRWYGFLQQRWPLLPRLYLRINRWWC
jgi:hypothetical protein